jgi:hypothetical protein
MLFGMKSVLTSSMRKTLLLVPLCLAAAHLRAQPTGEELFRTLATLDAALFDSYNKCDLEANRTFFADDLEFLS